MDIAEEKENRRKIMTITLLDLYNTAASQEWAMYDNDALSENEFEDSLVLALNKSILEIYSSYKFPFRERTHVILTIRGVNVYDLPDGLIIKDKNGKYLVKYNSNPLRLIDKTADIDDKTGIPDSFYVKNDKIVLYPIPEEKGLLTVDYMTLAIGENSGGEEIYSLKNQTDTLSVPVYLEELMKEAVITRTMLNSIASETDENFSAYKKQADRAYQLLIRYSKGVEQDKSVKI